MKSKKKSKMNLGQKIGLGMIVAAIGFPALFMGITLWREWTNTFCEGECVTGWYFVISVWLGIPTLFFGAFVFGIASLVRANKESNQGTN